MLVATPDAYQLIHETTQTLAAVEAVGMRIDVPYLQRMCSKAEQKIKTLSEELKSSDIWRSWKKRYGAKASLGSRKQLATILFGELQLPCTKQTANGQPSTEEEDLEATGHPFARSYVQLQKLNKLHGTYLKGVLREVEGEFLHPFFNTHLVRSYRTSSDSPNFQNIPVRNPEIAKVIRRAFIPRDGHVLLEIDFSAIEVRAAAWYHKDPTMLQYIETGHDMHKDMAMECFMLPSDQVSKQARYTAKNGFVFPEFYGSYYVDVASNIWNMIRKLKLETNGGKPLRKHLAENGIRSYQDFEVHVHDVEDRFWGERFPVYDQWRQDWYKAYSKRGCFRMLTGFVCSGQYRRNEVINLPVQGVACHCLLWSMNQIHNHLVNHRMRSKIIGQIHDSLEIDAHRKEKDDLLQVAIKTMTLYIRKHWQWIITPLDVEVEIAETNWYEKKPLEVQCV